jgi:prepilin-type N-terminal cleavage/methylation domain-containing protein
MPSGKGFSLVEIIVAIAIMAMVLVPVVSLLQHSHHQIADEKAEATVSTYASAIFNKALFQQNYVDVVSDTGEEVIDGTTIRWNLEVEQVSNLKLTYWRVKYHEPCAGGAASGSVELYPDFEQKAPSEIDVKYDDGQGVLKTLKLTLNWRSYYENFDVEDPRKVLVLATRKARLE